MLLFSFMLNYTVSRKKCAKLFSPELRQISTNFESCTQIEQRTDLCEVYLPTSPYSRQRPTVLNADVPNCYTTL